MVVAFELESLSEYLYLGLIMSMQRGTEFMGHRDLVLFGGEEVPVQHGGASLGFGPNDGIGNDIEVAEGFLFKLMILC